MLWLPVILVQLLTNWYWCSFSISGQLHRDGSRPSPKSVNVLLLLSPVSHTNAGRPPVEESPGRFRPRSPKASAAATFASGLIECGLYLNQPKRKSVSSVVLIALSNPAARLWL